MAVQTQPVGSLTIDSDLATEVADVLARTIEAPGRVLVVSDSNDSLVQALSARGWSSHQQAPLSAASTGVITFDADSWLSEWSSAPWDTVVVAGVLEFAVDPLAILRALRSVLAANGRLAVVVPNIVNASGFPSQDWEHLERIPIRFFTLEGLLSLLRSADLTPSGQVHEMQALIAVARAPTPRYDSTLATLSEARTAVMNLAVRGWSGSGDLFDAVRYRRIIHRTRGLVRATVPPEATVLVISRGDEALLALDQRPAWHFLMATDGKYAGHHPADSAEAIAHLELLRDRGAHFLVIPSTALWWLEYYDEFARHLERNYLTVLRQDDTCVVFNLEARP